MSNTTLGLTPGAAGIQQYSGTPTATSGGPAGGAGAAQYGGPYVQSEVAAGQQVQNQTQVDNIAQSSVQSRLLATQTASALQQEIDGTANSIVQASISAADNLMDEEIRQSKKVVDNAKDAV